jgi:hypothetical protein
MAKLQKFAALLAAGSVLGIFVIIGPTSAALAAPSSAIVKTADPVGTIESGDSESDDDDDDDAVEAPKIKKPHPKVEDGETSTTEGTEKKRRELREKFGTKDSLGLPPIVIHPEDDDDDEDDAVAVKPKKKQKVTGLVTPSPTSTPTATATVDPSIITNTSSLKGGQLATSPSAVKPSTTSNQAVNPQQVQGVTGSTSNQKTQSSNTLPEQQSAPIDIKNADVTGKTPTDKFFEASTSAIGAMAIGAVALGAVALVRGKRQQKELKAEYLYSSGE